MDSFYCNFVIKTDADPALLLDVLHEIIDDFKQEVESYGNTAEIEEYSPCVQPTGDEVEQ